MNKLDDILSRIEGSDTLNSKVVGQHGKFSLDVPHIVESTINPAGPRLWIPRTMLAAWPFR
jgi:hypothetical protein